MYFSQYLAYSVFALSLAHYFISHYAHVFEHSLHAGSKPTFSQILPTIVDRWYLQTPFADNHHHHYVRVLCLTYMQLGQQSIKPT